MGEPELTSVLTSTLTSTLPASPVHVLVHLLRVLTFVHLLGVTFTTGEMLNCEELPCQNHNVCRTPMSRDKNTTLPAHCVCKGKWAGPRCEVQLSLRPLIVQTELVLLEITGTNSKSLSDLNVTRLTLAIWNLNKTDECTLKKIDSNFTDIDFDKSALRISFLERNQKYVFCVANGYINLCAFYQSGIANYSKESNCVYVKTKHTNDAPFDIFFVVVPCVGALTLLVLVLFLYINRHSLLLKMFLNYCCCRSCYCCRRCYRRQYQRHHMRKHRSETTDRFLEHGLDPSSDHQDYVSGVDSRGSTWRSKEGSLERQRQYDFIESWPASADQDKDFLDKSYLTPSSHSQAESSTTAVTQLSESDTQCSDACSPHLCAERLYPASNSDSAYNNNESPIHSNCLDPNTFNGDLSNAAYVPRRDFYFNDLNSAKSMYQYQLYYPQTVEDDIPPEVTARLSTAGLVHQRRQPPRPNSSRLTRPRPYSMGDFVPVNIGFDRPYNPNSKNIDCKVNNSVCVDDLKKPRARHSYIDSTFGLSPLNFNSVNNQSYDQLAYNLRHSCIYKEPLSTNSNRYSYYSDIDPSLESDKRVADVQCSNTLPRVKRSEARINLPSNSDNDPLSTPTTGPDTEQYQLQNNVDLSNPHPSPMRSQPIPSQGSINRRRGVKRLINHFENVNRPRNGRVNKQIVEDCIEEEFRCFLSPITEDKQKTNRHSFFRNNQKRRSLQFIPNTSDLVFVPDSRNKMFEGHPSQHVIPPFTTDIEEEFDGDADDLNSLSHSDECSEHKSNGIRSDEDMTDFSLSDNNSITRFINPEVNSCFGEDGINLVTPFCPEDSTSDETDELSDEGETSCLRASTDTLHNHDTSES